MLDIYKIVLSVTSKKKINNKAVNEVINSLVADKEQFDKSLPKKIRERLGRR